VVDIHGDSAEQPDVLALRREIVGEQFVVDATAPLA